MDIALTMSVLDTTLTRIEKEQDSDAADVRAVTYHTPSAVAVIVSGDQADALEGVIFSGTGVSAAPGFVLPAVGCRSAWLPRPPFWTATGGTRDSEPSTSSPKSRSRMPR